MGLLGPGEDGHDGAGKAHVEEETPASLDSSPLPGDFLAERPCCT